MNKHKSSRLNLKVDKHDRNLLSDLQQNLNQELWFQIHGMLHRNFPWGEFKAG